MNKRLLLLVAIVAAGALAVPFVYAQGMGPGPGGGMEYHRMGAAGPGGPGWAKLTEEQRAKVAELKKEFVKETATLRQELRQKRLELAAIMAGPNPNEQQALAKLKEVTAAHEKLAEKMIQFRIKNRDVLKDLPGFGMGFGRGWRHHKGMGMMGQGMGPGMGFGPGMAQCQP